MKSDTKYKGKLHPVQAGELMHVINNMLNGIVLKASIMGTTQGDEIADRALIIGDYVRSLGEKENWDSSTFEYVNKTRKAA